MKAEASREILDLLARKSFCVAVSGGMRLHGSPQKDVKLIVKNLGEVKKFSYVRSVGLNVEKELFQKVLEPEVMYGGKLV